MKKVNPKTSLSSYGHHKSSKKHKESIQTQPAALPLKVVAHHFVDLQDSYE